MKNLAILALSVAILAAPGAAFAYVGPGAGLSLLGALWALVAAIGMALIFILAWPLRRMLRKRKSAGGAKNANARDDAREREQAG